MASSEGWFSRWVDDWPNQGWFKFASTYIVVPIWALKEPKTKLPGGPRDALQPSENLQRMMNLIMPLKDTSPVGRAHAAFAIAQNVDAIFAGLENVGTIHFARFDLIGDNICMLSVYDGDFTNYIRDFIVTIGSVFDAVIDLVEGGRQADPDDAKRRGVHRLGPRARPVPGVGLRHRPLRHAGGGAGPRARRPAAAAADLAPRPGPPDAEEPQPVARRRLPRLSGRLRRAGAASIRDRLVTIDDLDPAAIQGNVLRGYRGTLGAVRHLVLEVGDRAAARRFLGIAAGGGSAEVPAITTDCDWTDAQTLCFNVAVTFAGLQALGVPATSLETFPSEFVEGMPARAVRLSDVGTSAPATWPAPFDRPERVHLIATVYASVSDTDDGTAALDRIQAQVARAFTVLGTRDGRRFDEDRVHFDYVDSISQPRFRAKGDDTQPIDPLGTVLLGYPTRLEGVFFRVPEPRELGLNGSFSAFRILAQDVEGFETFLDKAADELVERLPGAAMHALLTPGAEAGIVDGLCRGADRAAMPPEQVRRLALREIVAAQMCGRWRDGRPYVDGPDLPPKSVSLTNYDYGPTAQCPVGSHVRRVNPRGGAMVQRIASRTRRLVRRSVPYGPPYDPARPDGVERGLLGNFINANLGAQFEAIMSDWLNLGLQHPEITRMNDPMLGAHTPETSAFDMVLRDGRTLRLRGFPQFVTTRGGAYTFIPSMAAIRHLAQLSG